MDTNVSKAEEIDTVIGEYIHPSALLCTDTATNYKKFAKLKGLQRNILITTSTGSDGLNLVKT